MLDRRAFIASAAAGLPTLARAAPPPAFPGGDIALLRRAYGALHPGLLRYATTEETELRLDSLAREFDRTSDLARRYLALSTFLATVKCGHTYANFFNQRNAVQGALFEGRIRLPFRFLWLGQRMIVTGDPTAAGVPPGTEVLSIDGRAAGDILRGLMTVARADGSNDDKRQRLMSVDGADGYLSFDIFFPLLFGARDRFALRIRTPDGREQSLTVEAIDLAARRAQSAPVAKPAPDAPVWSFERRGRIGVLDMPTWALYDSKWDWRGWLDGRFEEMGRENLTGLVIDLRHNEGGEDCGHEILARLIDSPLEPEARLRLVRYRRAPDALSPYLDTWDPSFKDWGAAAVPYDERYFRLVQTEDDGRAVGEIRPKRPRFRGRVAVLIGPENSSATFNFAQRIRAARLGVLVGEPTGGNQRGINGGAFFFLRLPESGLEADLPLIGQYPMREMPDAGLAPDIPAPLTAEAIASGRDPAMEAALKTLS